MTANRGPDDPVPFSAAWWTRHPEAYDRMASLTGKTPAELDGVPPIEPGVVHFTDAEMEAIMAVKPTPYLDEADRLDPTWAIPGERPKPVLPANPLEAWWRRMMGLDGP